MRLSDCMKQESLQQLYAHRAGHLYKTRQNYFLLNLGSAGLFLNTLFKTSQVQPLDSKSDPGEISSIALEQYPWSTIPWTIRQALLWGKFCCDAHTFRHTNSMADAWMDWKYLREDPSLLKGHWAKHNKTAQYHMCSFQLTLQKCIHWGILCTPHLEKRLSKFQHPCGYSYVCHVISFLETLLCLLEPPPASILARFYFYNFSLWLTS